MFKSKRLLLLFFIFLATIAPSHSTDNADQSNKHSKYHNSYQGLIGNFDYVPSDDLYAESQNPAPSPLNHAFVPDSHGNPQGRDAFKLLFSGQEDPATVRIITRPTLDQYTFRERLQYTIFGNKPIGYLTGTITPDGILTNAHGFVEEVPSFTNHIRKKFGRNRYYRTLEPLLIEQGLTLQNFTPENKDLLYNYNLIAQVPTHLYSHHAIYTQEEIESVRIDPQYTQNLNVRRGQLYGKIDSSADLALINFQEHHQFSHICPVAEKYPNTEKQVEVNIYQYPDGHPLQKMSKEKANFLDNTHQCVALPGSSGSSLRHTITGEIVGVHSRGWENQYNSFIPFDQTIAKGVNFKLYSRHKNVDE